MGVFPPFVRGASCTDSRPGWRTRTLRRRKALLSPSASMPNNPAAWDGKKYGKKKCQVEGSMSLSDSIWFYLILWLRIPVGIAHSKFQRPYLYFVLVSLCVCMKIKTPKPVLRETAAAAFSKISSSSSTLEDSWPSHAKTVTETLWLYGMSDRISSFICVSHYYIWLYLLISLIISGKNILYHISLSNCIWLFLIISYLYMYVYV